MDRIQLNRSNWNVVRGKLKNQFGFLSDDDLMYKEGNEEELIGRLQQALGKNRKEVVSMINSMCSSASSTSSSKVSGSTTQTPEAGKGSSFDQGRFTDYNRDYDQGDKGKFNK